MYFSNAEIHELVPVPDATCKMHLSLLRLFSKNPQFSQWGKEPFYEN